MGNFNWSDRLPRITLPIDGRLEEIVDLVRENQVVIVEAETGAGKTTRIPQALLLAGNLTGEEMPITMTATRRTAVRWNGKRIASEMGCAPGGLVGWRLSREKPVTSSRTRLTLCMVQSLVNRIRRSDGRLPEGVIIVDEAHERSVALDLLLGLIKEALPSSPNTKVLITSATIDTQKFSDFNGGAPIVRVSGRCYPVSTKVVEMFTGEHHTTTAIRAAGDVWTRFLAGNLMVPDESGASQVPVTRGSVLVLLPGKEDIAKAMESLLSLAGNEKHKIEVLSCHGESTSEEQDAIQRPVPKGVIRFVCGTEILRSSVTVQDTIGVIDSLQVKRMKTDAKGVAHLSKVAVSRAEADQAKGRAGRTAPGFYIAVSYNNEYSCLRPYPVPAILMEPITSVALEVADIGRSVRDFAFIDPPPVNTIDVAIKRLQSIGALDAGEEITPDGKILVGFPINPERARVLITADRLGVLPEAVVATAILEVEGIFHYSKDSGKKVYVSESDLRIIFEKTGHVFPENQADLPKWVSQQDGYGLFEVDSLVAPISAQQIADMFRGLWAGDSRSDFVAMVRAYRAYKTEEYRLRDMTHLNHKERNSLLRDWCFAHSLNGKKLSMAREVMLQIVDDMRNSPLFLENGFAIEREFDEVSLTKALASGMVDNLVSKRYEDYVGRLGQLSIAFSCPCRDARIALVDGVRKISVKSGRGRTNHMNLATLAAPIEPAWLVEVMPHLCTRLRLGDHTYNEGQDVVKEQEMTMFQGDLEIFCEWVESEDAAKSAKVFANWLAQQSLLPGSPIDTVLRSNAARQNRARMLNVRSGKNTFKVYSQSEISELFVEALSGARRVAEVVDIDALALPALNEEEAALVLSQNPEAIDLLGERLPVEYYQSYSGLITPKVRLTEEMVTANSWIHLPDEGVFLPSGNLVEITVPVASGWYTEKFTDFSIPQLKERVSNHLNKTLWNAWQRPTLEVPDAEDCESVVPFVVVVYGNCAVTGRNLVAYGTMSENTYRYSSSDPYFRAEWFQSLDKAQAACHASCLKLDELKVEAVNRSQEEIEKAALTLEYEEFQKIVESMCAEFSSELSDIDYSLTRDFREIVYGRVPTGVAEFKRTFPKVRALMSQIKEEIVKVQAKRAEEARKKAEAEARGNELYADLLNIIKSNYGYDDADLRLARRIDTFVSAALEARPKDALCILECERNATHGRARREEALKKAFPGVDHQNLEWTHGRDIYPVAEWAVYLTLRKNGTSKQQKVVEVEKPRSQVLTDKPITDGPLTFTLEDRKRGFFKCGRCNASIKPGKSDYRKWKDGHDITLECGKCGQAVFKAEKRSSEEEAAPATDPSSLQDFASKFQAALSSRLF